MPQEPVPSSSPVDDLLDLIEGVADLKLVPRMGWVLAGVPSPESVAEHSYGVALLTLLLAERINRDWQAEGLSRPVNVDRAVRLALLHDLGESQLTDLPKRSAELLGAETKRVAESRAIRSLFDGVAHGEMFVALWEEYNETNTAEALLVKDVDKLEMVHQAARYEQHGQTNLEEFWHDHVWNFRVSHRLFAALQARRHRLRL